MYKKNLFYAPNCLLYAIWEKGKGWFQSKNLDLIWIVDKLEKLQIDGNEGDQIT